MASISIIVPIYKAEQYMSKCIDSILNQTFGDFEVILVDDGSPDRSGEICDQYASKDSRIKVIHKNNGGVSAARQIGLDRSSGDYIIHADPDDWVEPEMLEEMYNQAKITRADMVISDYYIDNAHDTRRIVQKPSNLAPRTVLRELFINLHGSCWNKLIKRSCIVKNGITFPANINYCEDLIFNSRLIQKGIKISYLDKAFYHYVQSENPFSLVKNRTINEDLKVLEILDRELPKDIYDEVSPYICYSLVNHAFYSLHCSQSDYKKNVGQYISLAQKARNRSFKTRFLFFISKYIDYKFLRKIIVLLKN